MPNEAPYPSHAIFWYGKVDEYHNNTDVRIIYYPQGISFTLHIIDRLHWIDTTPTPGEIKDWDSVSVYLNMNDLFPATPQTTSYRFDIQLGGFYTIYKGNGSFWEKMTNVPVNIQTGWRGSQGPNSNVDGKGWQADLYIPFSSLGLAAPPPQNSIWGLAVTTYDRDDAAGIFRFTKTWPTSMQPDNPSTWGEMSFGWKPFNYPSAIPTGKTVLRHGLNNIIVRDGEVGGHTTCGEG
ncbi:MAG: hypothetical protein JSV61_10215, partial [Anaerolineales bacterium]